MKCIKCGQFGHATLACAAVHKPTKGQDNGGIRFLGDVKDRCRMDDIAGCWNWAQSFARGRPGSGLPVAWFPQEQRVVSVLRIIYTLTHADAVGSRMVWRTCGNDACVKPGHLLCGTRKEWGQWLAKNGLRPDKQGTASRRKVRINAGATKLTMELAHWARESGQTGQDVAHAIGVSPTQISRTRKLKTWAPSLPAASVFAWAATAALRKAA